MPVSAARVAAEFLLQEDWHSKPYISIDNGRFDYYDDRNVEEKGTPIENTRRMYRGSAPGHAIHMACTGILGYAYAQPFERIFISAKLSVTEPEVHIVRWKRKSGVFVKTSDKVRTLQKASWKDGGRFTKGELDFIQDEVDRHIKDADDHGRLAPSADVAEA